MRDRLRAQDPPCLTQLSGGPSASLARVDLTSRRREDTAAGCAKSDRKRPVQICQAEASSADSADSPTAAATAPEGANAASAPRVSAVTWAASRLASAICR